MLATEATMKKIVLHHLPSEIEQLIDEKATSNKVTRTEAVLRILAETALERAIEHDMALLESWLTDEADDGLFGEGSQHPGFA